ncbi:unnamed protein product [Enterobius vermicularis]|uniref:DUF148 domain-containing protein n=1 Tax=Enterobius vermicularis TaxID=51028 RepID=A0A0N4VIH4_ENTVE|nr:unnamed protein product [Enterobius vermicularis]
MIYHHSVIILCCIFFSEIFAATRFCSKQIILFIIVIVSQKSSQCGLAPFVEDLPAPEKEEIKEVWRNYRTGNDCEEQRRKTQEVIDGLTDEARAKLKNMPAFLKTASSNVRSQFIALWNNFSMPVNEKIEKFRELAKELLNSQQLELFKRYDEEVRDRKKLIEEKVSQLSPEARTAFDQLSDLQKQRSTILNNLSKEARREIRVLLNSVRRA